MFQIVVMIIYEACLWTMTIKFYIPLILDIHRVYDPCQDPKQFVRWSKAKRVRVATTDKVN